MVAAGEEPLGNISEQWTAGMADLRHHAVIRLIERGQPTPEILDDGLQSQADAESRNTALDKGSHQLRAIEVGRPSRPRRQHDEIRVVQVEQIPGRVLRGPPDGAHPRSGLPEVAGEHVYE